MSRLLTLTTDSDARKRIPLIDGLWGYFAAALVAIAEHSFKSNQKHNGDAPLHWSIDKSTDHAECCGRHMLDLKELIALYENGGYTEGEAATEEVITSILSEGTAHAWRALALLQTLHMRFRGAPMPFNAQLSRDPTPPKRDYLGRPLDPNRPLTATELVQGSERVQPLPPLNALDMPAYDPPTNFVYDVTKGPPPLRDLAGNELEGAADDR